MFVSVVILYLSVMSSGPVMSVCLCSDIIFECNEFMSYECLSL